MGKSIIRKIAEYLEQFIVFPEENQSMLVAAWIATTHCWEIFNALAFLTITARTKRAGKSTLGVEILPHLCHKGLAVVAPTPASIYSRADASHPTMIFDEAEGMSSEAKGVMHSIMNSGYKRGLFIERKSGQELIRYNMFNPYVFVLIGSTADTIRDRSIVIELARTMEAAPRTVGQDVELAQSEMKMLHDELRTIIGQNDLKIVNAYKSERAPYLVSSRDEEICRPVLAVAHVIGTPEDYAQIQAALTDASAAKSAPPVEINKDAEKLMQEMEYALRLAKDVVGIMDSGKYENGITANELIEELYSMPLAPWRKYLGVGLTPTIVADLMKAAGHDSGRSVVTMPFRRKKNAKPMRGYKWEQIERLRKAQ